MKLILLCLLAGTISTISFAQNDQPSIKKNIVSVDIGLFGTWINYEKQLKEVFTVKSSLGLEGGFVFGSSINYFTLTPTLRLEPRFYYNFKRRVKMKKKTSFNASNYFAVTLLYIPNLFTISNVSGLEYESGVHVIPKFGIKRTIGQKVNFEFAIGAGPYISKGRVEAALGLDLRFGYNFK